MFRAYQREAKYNSYPCPPVIQGEFSSNDRIGNRFKSSKSERKFISEPLLQSQGDCATGPVRLFSDPTETKTLEVWEGIVKYVGNEEFVVQFVDVDHEFQPPKFLGEFDKSDLSNEDLDFLEIGSIIKLEIMEKKLPNEEVKEYYDVKLIRLPEITEEDIERARIETEELLERLGSNEAKTT